MTGSGGHEVRQQTQPEAAHSSSHEIGGIGVEQRASIGYRETRRGICRWSLQHEFPLVLAARHETQGLRIVRVVENGDRQGRQRPPIEQVEAGFGKMARQVGIVDHQPIHVDCREAQVLAEDVEAERIVAVDVDLANLAVPPARPQHLQAQFQVAAGQRIQHHIDACTAGRLHCLVVPVFPVRVEGCSGPQRQKPSAFGLTACRGIDLRSHTPGKRDGSLSHATHRGMDEHALALAESSEVDQGVVRGDVDRQR